jgi:hypothetical protein
MSERFGRLPICDVLHKGEPSQLRTYMREGRKGESYPNTYCKACNRVRGRLNYQGKAVPTVQVRYKVRIEPYGVLPRLTWPAPEFLT